jgi:general secretion pathway protein H
MIARSYRRAQRGLTLLEVLITIGVVMLLMGVVVTSFGTLKSTELRTQTNKLAAAVRHTYNRSVANGLYMRLVVDISGDAYWVEASETPVFMSKKKLKEGEIDEEKQARVEAAEKRAEEGLPPAPQRERFQTDPVIEKVSMEKGIKIVGVYTTSMEDPFESGTAYVHFFPNGFVEPSMLYTSDGEDRTYTLSISPMTGKVTRTLGKLDPDKEFGVPEVQEEGR